MKPDTIYFLLPSSHSSFCYLKCEMGREGLEWLMTCKQKYCRIHLTERSHVVTYEEVGELLSKLQQSPQLILLQLPPIHRLCGVTEMINARYASGMNHIACSRPSLYFRTASHKSGGGGLKIRLYNLSSHTHDIYAYTDRPTRVCPPFKLDSSGSRYSAASWYWSSLSRESVLLRVYHNCLFRCLGATSSIRSPPAKYLTSLSRSF